MDFECLSPKLNLNLLKGRGRGRGGGRGGGNGGNRDGQNNTNKVD